jgi:rare lipoprotein A
MLRRLKLVCVCMCLSAGLVACAATKKTPRAAPEATAQWVEAGIASVYAGKFQGRRTANGERYNSSALTAAHPSLPFGSMVRVTSLTNGKTVVVRINDRGPFVEGRVIDLSLAAAQALRLNGLMQVEVQQLR